MNSTSIHCGKFNDCVEIHITVGLNVLIYKLQGSIYFPRSYPYAFRFPLQVAQSGDDHVKLVSG
jgi:hypothetical protein